MDAEKIEAEVKDLVPLALPRFKLWMLGLQGVEASREVAKLMPGRQGELLVRAHDDALRLAAMHLMSDLRNASDHVDLALTADGCTGELVERMRYRRDRLGELQVAVVRRERP